MTAMQAEKIQPLKTQLSAPYFDGCAEGELRAFANSCRHRGARLLNDQGECKRIVCPYHSWSYRLDGSLAGTPGMQDVEDFDATTLR